MPGAPFGSGELELSLPQALETAMRPKETSANELRIIFISTLLHGCEDDEKSAFDALVARHGLVLFASYTLVVSNYSP